MSIHGGYLHKLNTYEIIWKLILKYLPLKYLYFVIRHKFTAIRNASLVLFFEQINKSRISVVIFHFASREKWMETAMND